MKSTMGFFEAVIQTVRADLEITMGDLGNNEVIIAVSHHDKNGIVDKAPFVETFQCDDINAQALFIAHARRHLI